MLHEIALRILKCKTDAEDAVHDAFEKWLQLDNDRISNAKAYLAKTVRNISLNKLKTTENQKTQSLEDANAITEVIVPGETTKMETEGELKRALAVIQSRLEPLERLVVLLREVFNFDYEVMTGIVDKTAENCRQILSRAKKKLTTVSKINPLVMDSKLEETFKKSISSGSYKELVKHLKEDIQKKSPETVTK